MATADKVSIPPLKVWRGHRCGLFVEGVAVDTDGREAALRTRGKSEQAACCRECRYGADEAEPEIHATLSVKATSSAKRLSPIRLHSSRCTPPLASLSRQFSSWVFFLCAGS